MKKLQPTTQFRKDLKKYKNQPKKLKALKEVLEMLSNETKEAKKIFNSWLKTGNNYETFTSYYSLPAYGKCV